MKTVLAVALTCIGSTAAAQELSWYTVEDRTYFQATGCTPGSKASFYSSAHGGRLLRTQTVAADGTALYAGPDSLRPRMVLNSGANGSHRVAFLKARELAFAAPALERRSGQNILTWEAAALAGTGVSFEVLRSIGGKPFQPVTQLPARTAEVTLPYTYTETAPEDAVYRIRVLSKARGQRHLSAPMQTGGAAAAIAVYPTAVTWACYISSSGEREYAVFSQDGRKLSAGPLRGTKTAVPMEHLASGAYIVRVSSGGKQREVKVLRQ